MPERDVPFGLAARDPQMKVLSRKQRTLSEFRSLLESSKFRLTETGSTACLEPEPV